MKLETPEGRAFVKLWNDYDPQIGFDLHTSDGSYHGYYLTYAPPLNPATNDAIMANMKDEWFPFVTKEVKTKHGWDTFYYGNTGGGPGAGAGRGGAAAGAPGGAGAGAAGGAAVLQRGGAAGAAAARRVRAARRVAVRLARARGGCGRGAACGAAGARRGAGGQRGGGRGTRVVRAAGHADARRRALGGRGASGLDGTDAARGIRSRPCPATTTATSGMRNRFALLSEAYAYATFEDRIKATNYFMEESLNFAMQNADASRRSPPTPTRNRSSARNSARARRSRSRARSRS